MISITAAANSFHRVTNSLSTHRPFGTHFKVKKN